MAQDAAPNVLNVAAAPAQAGLPDSSAASSEPMERVEPRANPPNIWPEVSTFTVLRCRILTSFSFTTPA
jgi:hypothetical protein